MRRPALPPLLALCAAASPLGAGAQAPERASTASATVRGVVRDSLGGGVLAGARVQLVDSGGPWRFGRTVVADSQGGFLIDSVPVGRYTLGFLHPALDSLGLEAPVRALRVADDLPIQADLALPGAERVRSAICGAPETRASVVRSGSGSGAVVAGVVRHASGGGPVAGATVSAEWMEVTIQRGLSGRIRRLTARTADDGWFAFCDVPRAGAVGMLAAHGADSTGAVELQAPPSGYVHRVLYVGGVATDTAAGAPRLRGTVVAAAAPGRPLGGALVRVPGGPETRTDDRGEWVLAGAPPGTRTIEVRAVGYYPQRRVVDVTAGSPPVRVALSRFEAVLDTIRVTAAPADRDQIDFLRRARSGAGRYLTPADIARRRPIVTTDLFRNLSGLRLEGYGQSARLSMRGGMSAFGGGGDDRCAPHVYLNGVHFEAGPDDLDTWITPRRIKGIEVYPDATVPVQFRPPMQTCGSIVIWMH